MPRLPLFFLLLLLCFEFGFGLGFGFGPGPGFGFGFGFGVGGGGQILTCHSSDMSCEPSTLGRVVFDNMATFGYHSEYVVNAKLKVIQVRNVY